MTDFKTNNMTDFGKERFKLVDKYKLADGQQGEKILLINDAQSVCPFVPPIPLKGSMGQMQIMRMPCTTLCPLAVLYDEDITKIIDGNVALVGKKTMYEIKCGSGITLHEIEKNEEAPKQGGSGLSIVK